MESTYTLEQIAEMNILSVLSKESERTNRGIKKDRLLSMFRFDPSISFQNLLSELQKGQYIKFEKDEISIIKSGRNRLRALRMRADKPALELFARHEPIAFQTFSRVSFLEGTVSALTLAFISAIFLIINELVRLNVSPTSYPFWLYLTFLIVFAVIFLPSFVILLVSSFILLIRGMGMFIKPISFELWLYMEENAEKIAKVVILILIAVGIIISYIIAGIPGLIRGFVVGTVFWLISHFKKIIEWVRYIVEWFKKKH